MKTTTLPIKQSSRSKLPYIIEAATRQFAEKGFEAARWSDIAAEVGIGQTALYHYFQSKTECLFALVVVQFEEASERMKQAITNADDADEQIRRAIRSNFDLSEIERLRSRIVVSERNRLAEETSGREEDMRQLARDWARRTEKSWSKFLEGHMDAGAIPRQDPVLLTRAVLGLTSSAYSWYRAGGSVSFDVMRDFYTDSAMKLVMH